MVISNFVMERLTSRLSPSESKIRLAIILLLADLEKFSEKPYKSSEEYLNKIEQNLFELKYTLECFPSDYKRILKISTRLSSYMIKFMVDILLKKN